jgi:hypothetical protein
MLDGALLLVLIVLKSAKHFLKHSTPSIHHTKAIQKEQFGSYSIMMKTSNKP